MQQVNRCYKGKYIRITPVFCLLLFTCLITTNALAAPSDDFVTTWKTDNPGTSNDTSITLPMVGGPYDVDWDNDEIFDEFGRNGPVTHDYGVVGTHTIRIRGNYDSIRFNNDGDREKILSLEQWGTNSWTSMSWAFAGAINLTIPATDIPDFSAVTDMSYMFNGASSANPDTSGWDTSAVTNMLAMFQLAVTANPDTKNWDTSAVTDMGWMFYNASAANPDTTDWNTAAVINMSSMFTFASSANPITHNWDTAAVTDMSYMFYEAKAAKPDNKYWNTASVTNTYSMFYNATAFDQDIGSWNVSALLDASYMFTGATLSRANYESLLIGWDAQALQAGVSFSGGNSMYCSAAAVAARANMIASDSWDITDGGRCSEIFQDGFEDVLLSPECPCWDEIELTSVTAANHDDAFSCDTHSSFPLSAAIQNTDFVFPVVEGGFSATDDGANTSCNTRDFGPHDLQITTDEASECIVQIAARCAAIGHPITNPD